MEINTTEYMTPKTLHSVDDVKSVTRSDNCNMSLQKLWVTQRFY